MHSTTKAITTTERVIGRLALCGAPSELFLWRMDTGEPQKFSPFCGASFAHAPQKAQILWRMASNYISCVTELRWVPQAIIEPKSIWVNSVAHRGWCATETRHSVAHGVGCATESGHSVAHGSTCATESDISVAHVVPCATELCSIFSPHAPPSPPPQSPFQFCTK